jgi:beta-glucosidase
MLNVRGAKTTREIQAEAMKLRLHTPLLFSLDVIHGYKTVFQIPLAQAASWDLDAIRLGAHVAAKEVAAAGLHWTFAPMVDVGKIPIAYNQQYNNGRPVTHATNRPTSMRPIRRATLLATA